MNPLGSRGVSIAADMIGQRPPVRTVAMAVLAGLLLTACAVSPPALTAPSQGSVGTTADSAPRSASHSACDLVTEQQLRPLLGADPGPGKDTSDGATNACVYTGAGAVSIVVDHSGSSSTLAMYCGLTAAGSHPQQLGIADGGCFTIVGGSIAVVYILKGTDLLSINIQAGLDTKMTAAELTALGGSAAGRL